MIINLIDLLVIQIAENNFGLPPEPRVSMIIGTIHTVQIIQLRHQGEDKVPGLFQLVATQSGHLQDAGNGLNLFFTNLDLNKKLTGLSTWQ